MNFEKVKNFIVSTLESKYGIKKTEEEIVPMLAYSYIDKSENQIYRFPFLQEVYWISKTFGSKTSVFLLDTESGLCEEYTI